LLFIVFRVILQLVQTITACWSVGLVGYIETPWLLQCAFQTLDQLFNIKDYLGISFSFSLDLEQTKLATGLVKSLLGAAGLLSPLTGDGKLVIVDYNKYGTQKL
jgi:hypothetical protein